MNHDKNAILKVTARAASTVGVEKLVCVCPIEYDMYYGENHENPVELRNEAEAEAKSLFPNLTILRPNLVFGNYSYTLRYLEQSVLAGKVPKALCNEGDYTKYSPVHFDDLFSALKDTLESDSHNGQTYTVNGGDDLRLVEIVDLIKSATGKDSVTVRGNLGISDFVFDFFQGITHDRNMRLMAAHYNTHPSNFKENDFFTEQDTHPENRLSATFFETRHEEQRFVHPTFAGYKSVSLD